MHALRSRIRSRPVLWFYVVAVLLSWSYWFILLASGARVAPGSSATHLPGLMGPMISAVLIAWLAFGKAAVSDLFRRCVRLPAPRPRNALLALSPLLIAGAVFLVLSVSGIASPVPESFREYPGLPAGLAVPVLFLAVLLLNGFGEEVGWRGFALEGLVPRFGKFNATLLVAALWLAWHAPLFWLNANMQALVGPALLGWAFGLLCGAFVLAGLYLASGRSILVVALWHTFYNFTVATPASSDTAVAVISSVVMAWGGYFAFVWWRAERGKPTA